MSLLRPMKKSIATSAKPITLARSITRSGDRLAAHLLDQAPEDVAAVERQDRQQVDQAEREADQGEQQQRRGRRPTSIAWLATSLIPTTPEICLRCFGFEDVGEDVDRSCW